MISNPSHGQVEEHNVLMNMDSNDNAHNEIEMNEGCRKMDQPFDMDQMSDTSHSPVEHHNALMNMDSSDSNNEMEIDS